MLDNDDWVGDISEEHRRSFFKQIIHQNIKKAYGVECDKC